MTMMTVDFQQKRRHSIKDPREGEVGCDAGIKFSSAGYCTEGEPALLLSKRRHSMNVHRWSSKDSSVPLVDKCPGRWKSPASSPAMPNPKRISSNLKATLSPRNSFRTCATDPSPSTTPRSWHSRGSFPFEERPDVLPLVGPPVESPSVSSSRWESPFASPVMPSPRRRSASGRKTRHNSCPSNLKPSFKTCATDRAPPPSRNWSFETSSIGSSSHPSGSFSLKSDGGVPGPPTDTPTTFRSSDASSNNGDEEEVPAEPCRFRRSSSTPTAPARQFSIQSKDSSPGSSNSKRSRHRSRPSPPSWGELTERSASLRRNRASSKERQQYHQTSNLNGGLMDNDDNDDDGHDFPKEIFCV